MLKQITNKLVELLRESTLTQVYITIAFVTLACVLWYQGVVLPRTLENLLLVVMGFYFGRKYNSVSQKGK